MATTPTAGTAGMLVDSLQDSIGFRELGALLKERDLPTAKSWEILQTRLSEDGKFQSEVEPVLRALAAEIVVAGNKAVTLFELDEEETVTLSTEFRAVHPDAQTKFAKSFPLRLGPTDIAGAGHTHELVHRIDRSNGDISFVLCAKRTEEERETYERSEVTEAVQAAFEGFQKFIALRTRPYQVFDVVTLRPRLRRLEVLIDKPSRILAPETVESRTLELLMRLSASVPGLIPLHEANSPINLFPCIAGLYGNGKEGRVTFLQFRSSTKSTKREAMTARDDLRTESFHAAGIAAIGTISPFHIKVEWDKIFGASGPAAVEVKAHIRSLSELGGLVREARITEARDDSAIQAVVNKLISYSSG